MREKSPDYSKYWTVLFHRFELLAVDFKFLTCLSLVCRGFWKRNTVCIHFPSISLSLFPSNHFPPKCLRLLHTLTCISPPRKEFLQQRRAAVTLQAWWRGWYNRRNFKLVRERCQAGRPRSLADMKQTPHTPALSIHIL